MSPKYFPALPVALALAACNQSSDEPVSPEPATLPTQSGETVSILRPDVEGPVEPTPAEPLIETIPFEDGGSDLSAGALAKLKEIVAGSEFAGAGAITLRGHSDAGGSDAVNMRASEARAEAVKDWLVENGASEERITVIAFGEQNPIKPNANPDGSPNEEGRAANRRVEVTIQPADSDDAPAEQQAAAPETEAAE